MTPGVDRQNGSYRQGLILGLTMAELLLLLVFCLLIALAALLADAKLKLAGLEDALQQAKVETLQTRALLDGFRDEARLASLAPPPDATVVDAAVTDGLGATSPVAVAPAPADTWDRLVAADGTVETLKAAGLDPARLVEDSDLIKALAPLAEEKGVERVVADVALGDALRERLGVAPDAPLTVDAVADFVTESRTREEAVNRKLVEAEREMAALRERVDDLADVEPGRDGRPTDLPPILTLREGEGFYFETGSAALGPDFAARLHDRTAARLKELVDRYDVDVIEVIGHTDEQPVARERVSNLDGALLDVVRGGQPVDRLVPADNAGLGLARAVAVSKALAGDARLQGLDILPLSAAHLIGTDGRVIEGATFANVAERRRIEIRLRRSGAPAG
ncbi:hypothetical protein [Chthonobacter rhizosphaerae]|uniref:hypothetical protein n=1 Tax=Chthonobacter rhizosphaerae TaxID=2735553 RepID=UPI0015EE7993|nr:hypothetical protein [Chthonobacter rhizosphaerae]